MEENKQESNTAGDKAVNHRPPPLRLSAFSSPVRSPQNIQERSFALEISTPSTPSREEYAIAMAITPTQSTTLSADRHGLVVPNAPLPYTKDTGQQRISGTDGNAAAFNRLRVAMEAGDTSLFAPLQVALVDLIKVGNFLKVQMFGPI